MRNAWSVIRNTDHRECGGEHHDEEHAEDDGVPAGAVVDQQVRDLLETLGQVGLEEDEGQGRGQDQGHQGRGDQRHQDYAGREAALQPGREQGTPGGQRQI